MLATISPSKDGRCYQGVECVTVGAAAAMRTKRDGVVVPPTLCNYSPFHHGNTWTWEEEWGGDTCLDRRSFFSFPEKAKKSRSFGWARSPSGFEERRRPLESIAAAASTTYYHHLAY